MEDKKLTVIEHLEELRSRIIKSIIFIIIASIFSYAFVDSIFNFIVKPVGSLVFITPAEAFITNIKIAVFGGVCLSSPFVLYEIWRFLSTGLGEKEKRFALLFGLFSFFLFILGGFLGFFVIVPIGIRFLLSFSTDFVKPMISVAKYVSFVGGLTFVFALIFQLPLVILFLTKAGILTPQYLSKNRKYAIVIIFIVAAILTPPDVISQCLMAIPLLVLYEVSIFLSKLVHR